MGEQSPNPASTPMGAVFLSHAGGDTYFNERGNRNYDLREFPET
jgi:hypothetical protein